MLTLSQISVMKIEKGLIENLPNILKELSSKMEWSVKELNSAVLPKIETDKQNKFVQHIRKFASSFATLLFDDDNIDTLLTIYTYAFDKDNEIISAEEFIEKINSIEIQGVDWAIESVEPHTNNNIIIKREQSKGLLIAVIIVSIAFVCYIVASIFILKTRKGKNHDMVYTTKPTNKVEDNSGETNPRISVIINDNLIGSSNSDGDESTRNTLRVINARERKKSNVTFNDQVQQIELKDSEIH